MIPNDIYMKVLYITCEKNIKEKIDLLKNYCNILK